MGEMVQISVQGFSGPVDLLLDLIDNQQLDITALSLAEVTDQYWRELETAELDADTLSEFINIGSRLLYIKSCALLPGARQPAADLNAEIDQAAEELTQMLEEHKRFKDAFDLFRQLEEEGRRTFARMTPAWWKSASTASSEPASAAVCEPAAFAPARVRPPFMARIGFVRATRRARRANLRGLPNDSR